MNNAASGIVTKFHIDPDHGAFASFYLDQSHDPNPGKVLDRTNPNDTGVTGWGMVTISTPFHERVADALQEAFYNKRRVTVNWVADGGSNGNGFYPDIRSIAL